MGEIASKGRGAGGGREYPRRLPGSRREAIENCGRHPELEATEQFVALVEGFLE